MCVCVCFIRKSTDFVRQIVCKEFCKLNLITLFDQMCLLIQMGYIFDTCICILLNFHGIIGINLTMVLPSCGVCRFSVVYGRGSI